MPIEEKKIIERYHNFTKKQKRQRISNENYRKKVR